MNCFSKSPQSFSFIILFFFLTLLAADRGSAQTMYKKREMRGVWIATVANIDWPRNRKQSSEEKIADLKEMVSELHRMGFNALFFQVRTECDALYPSKIEPWSYWLTGEQGTAPEPFFDPLEIIIREAHALNMELHAWFNPYRAVKNTNSYPLSEDHVARKNPDWLLTFKDYQMLNPGLPQVRAYVSDVVSDVISRYDVDGVHFDDYFYPYGPKVSSEDAATYRNSGRGIGNIDDWRRDNINLLMKELYELIQRKKPWVKFGVSPFGIVENKYAQTGGFESYNILYCDPLTWIKNRTVDYVLPQLYWEMNHAKAPFAPLFRWWESISQPAALWVGHFSSSFLSDKFKGSPSELYDQLRMVRESEKAGGSVLFSARALMQNARNVRDSLEYRWFLYPALQPLMYHKDTVPPPPVSALRLDFQDNRMTLTWKRPESSKTVTGYIVYRFYDHEPLNLEDPRSIAAILPADKLDYDEMVYYKVTPIVYVVTAIDRLSNESTDNTPVVLEFR